MTLSRLRSQIEYNTNALDTSIRLRKTPIVLTDSNTRYLRDEVIQDIERDVVWWFEGGAIVEKQFRFYKRTLKLSYIGILVLYCIYGLVQAHALTELFSFQTPSHDSLHAPITHSTAVRPTIKLPFSGTVTIQEEVPPTQISFQPESSVGVSLPHTLNYKMERLAKCTEFHGYPQDNGNTFLIEFESFITLHGLSEFNLTNKRMLAAFHLHLKGAALTWYNSLSDESKSDWKSVRILFKEKYVNFCGRWANALMHSEIFQNLTLSSGQSVEDFYCQIYEKGMPQDMQNALASAKMAEAYGYRKHDDSVNAAGLFKNKSRHNSRTADDQNTEVRDLRQQIEELSELVKAQKEMKSDKSSPQAPAAASSEISK
ncbi:unnamed protein product [Mytilus coruscus]|uniref:Retrotransposon gag domain-containing protein n=1 Tax=Mytilus coruscus TaxID=42192 RepID=A0A6J8C8L2_MYTCO|nr:unnamed protein product [Mytilus coruscus]